jgi:hypothetical protein
MRNLIVALLCIGCVPAETENAEEAEALCALCGPTLQPVTDTTIAAPSLASFTPAAVNDSGIIDVIAFSTQGLAMRRFANNSWGSRWTQLGAPVSGLAVQLLNQSARGDGFDRTLSAIARPGTPNDDWIFYGWRNGSTTRAGRSEAKLTQTSTFSWSWTLTNTADSVGFTTTTGGLLDTGFFNPASPVHAAARSEIHVFGSGFIYGEAIDGNATASGDFVIDRVQNTATGAVRYLQVANPPGVSRVAVGPGSAVVRAGTPTVFFNTNALRDPSSLEVFSQGNVRSYRLEQQWNGLDMGTPVSRPYLFGSPLAVTWNDGHDDHINLFVVSYNTADGRFHLYQRSLGACADFSCWDSWQDFGSPPNLDGRKFRMTTGTVWRAVDGGLRIDLFGATEATRLGGSVSGSGAQALVHYTWDGSSWGWETTETAPDGGDVRVSSSLAIGQRVSAFVRSSTGRIWERAGLASGAVVWTDLSLVPPITTAGP